MHEITCKRKIAKKCDPSKERENRKIRLLTYPTVIRTVILHELPNFKCLSTRHASRQFVFILKHFPSHSMFLKYR